MDIVIPVKTSIINEELRYTLRSIDKNMPSRKVWLIGYKPDWVHGVEFVQVSGSVSNKYRNVAASIRTACQTPAISDDFLLFNDDFFVLKPVSSHIDFKRCSIADSIIRLSAFGPGTYLDSLKLTGDILQQMGVDDPADYGLHIPITYNKQRWLKAWRLQLEHNPDKKPVHMRTIYGNLYDLAKDFMEDIKISDLTGEPTGDETYLSVNDTSFVQGKIGDYIREQFSDPCKFEGARSNTFVLK